MQETRQKLKGEQYQIVLTLVANDGQRFASTLQEGSKVLGCTAPELLQLARAQTGRGDAILSDPKLEEQKAMVVAVPLMSSRMLGRVLAFLREGRLVYECEASPDSPSPALQQVIAIRPLQSPNLEKTMSPWMVKFLDMEAEELLELAAIAEAIGFTYLNNAVCAKLATLLAGRSPNAICQMFGVDNDFSEEERRRVRTQHPWLSISS